MDWRTLMAQIYSPVAPSAPRGRLAKPIPFARWVDAAIIAAVVAGAYGIIVAASHWEAPLTPATSIDLSPRALPLYAGLSTLRMALAYLLALVFSLVYARTAAQYRRAERVMVPVLHLPPRIPPLSFLPSGVLPLLAPLLHTHVARSPSTILVLF